MTEILSEPAASGIAPGTSARMLYRIAGWGGILAFVSWAMQPVIVAVSSATIGDAYPDWQAAVGGRTFVGALETAVFVGIAVGLLFFVLATAALVRRAVPASIASMVGIVFGVVGAVAWLFTAGAGMAEYTSVGAGIPEVAPDTALQAALMQTLAVGLTGTLVTTSLGMAGFTVFLVTAARRARVIGWPLAAVAILFLAIFLGSFAIPLAPPWGMIGFVVMALVFGIAFLVKARKA